MTEGQIASIHARLLNRAKARGEDFNLILTRYALERFLYRLSLAPAREAYWLKGAMLFDLWFDVPHRPTRDADFLGFGPMDIEALANTVREICGITVDDGMAYDPDSITVEEIREDARYGGLRVRLLGLLGKARCTGCNSTWATAMPSRRVRRRRFIRPCWMISRRHVCVSIRARRWWPRSWRRS